MGIRGQQPQGISIPQYSRSLLRQAAALSKATPTVLFVRWMLPAGAGIKEGYVTNRVVREVDIAPTVAALAGVRMPAQCEGAPVYQIIEA